MKSVSISKRIELLEQGTFEGKLKFFEENEILLAILKQPSDERGVAFSENKTRSDLIDKIRAAMKADQPTVLLEKTDYDSLIHYIEIHRFPFVDPAMRDWIKGLKDLEDVKVKEVKSARG